MPLLLLRKTVRGVIPYKRDGSARMRLFILQVVTLENKNIYAGCFRLKIDAH